ncbi:MAG: NAD(P)H-dependent oxidoreductase [Anaerolineales bacterium]|nr:NAD(P)H-dependent oxidoreductase [Anaerolineales bacterium]
MTTIIGIGGTLSPHSRNLAALEHALQSATAAGAQTELYSVFDLQLPMLDPHKVWEDYGPTVHQLVEAMRRADGLIISTAAYHGTMAGVTKNALDYAEFLSGGPTPYWHNKVVGLIATASGTMAGPNTLTGLTHVVHALRGVVVPLMVAIPDADNAIDREGHVTDNHWANRLAQLGHLVVTMAQQLNSVQAL